MKAVATVLCNNLLVRAKKERIPVTTMKLQRLLYYVCVEYAKETGTIPISEQFEVWKYGPVVPSVHAEFSPYRSDPIEKLARDAKGYAKKVDEDANPILKECLESVWGRFRYFPGIELSKLTQQKGSGWYAAFQRDDELISVEDMKLDATI